MITDNTRPTHTELMQILSTPRPNGSAAERQVYAQLKDWLDQRGIAYTEQPFRLYPWLWQGIGVWLIVSRVLLALAVWLGWGWVALAIAVPALLGGLLDVATDYPTAGRFGATTGYNLLVHFNPPQPRRELVLSAHYDTKTELLDHRQRMFFLRNLPVGIVLTVLLGVFAPLQTLAAGSNPSLAAALWWAGVVLSLPLVALAVGLGLNLALGGLRRNPSRGAVDNGAACAILLRLAEHYRHNPGDLHDTRLTLALFGGEEVNMQGSRAYVRSLPPQSLPRAALNLEVMAQDGEYVIWEQDGMSLKLWPNSPEVIQAAAEAVEAETGAAPLRVGPVNSDGGSFIRAGIPSATLGTYDRVLRDRGFHQPSDNLGRVVPERIPEAVRILRRFVEGFDVE